MSNGRRKWGLGLLLAAGFLALLYAAGSGLPYGPHIERTLCGRFEEVLEAGGWNCNGNAAFQEGLDFSIQEEWYGFGAGAYDLNHRPYSLMLDALCREYPGLGWSRLPCPRYVAQARIALTGPDGTPLYLYACGIFSNTLQFEYGRIILPYPYPEYRTFPLDTHLDRLREEISALRGNGGRKGDF